MCTFVYDYIAMTYFIPGSIQRCAKHNHFHRGFLSMALAEAISLDSSSKCSDASRRTIILIIYIYVYICVCVCGWDFSLSLSFYLRMCIYIYMRWVN